MRRFHRLEDCEAVIRRKGVWRQVPMYERDELLYVKVGAGYVRLVAGGRTSDPDVLVDDYEVPAGAHRVEEAFNRVRLVRETEG